MLPLYCFILVALCFQSAIKAQKVKCVNKTELSGYLKETVHKSEKCWIIQVPAGSYMHLNFKKIDIPYCHYGSVKITTSKTGEEYTYCAAEHIKNPVISLSPVTITLREAHGYTYSFELLYNIESIICIQPNTFRCSKHSCIPKHKICDGVKDCENGADEKGCGKETGVLAIRGISEIRRDAILWLKSKRTQSWGWKENTHRAIVALYLADGANFNGTSKEEELMAKEAELTTAVAILRNGTDRVSPNQLSMLVNSLLTVCLNPRKFYGFNLVELLKKQLKGPSVIPVVYLALCNANEIMPEDTIPKLRKVLSTNSQHPFLIDYQAMASMTIACMKNRKIGLASEGNFSIMHSHHSTLKQFKLMQREDGSFGNVYQTALVAQALLSGGQENNGEWNLKATIRYLMAQLNSSSVDFLTTYFTLPVLNGKTLVDIAKINCSGNPRKQKEDQVVDIESKLGPKMRVQYSLYVGDEKDIVHTLSLRVPANITVYEIMEIAEATDDKYNFKSKRVSGKMYVYEIARILNDPEDGKFWILYKGPIGNSTAAIEYTESPDKILVQDQEHLIMWYKTMHI